MGESKGEGGSWLYGIILIATGGMILVIGLLNALGISIVAEVLELAGYGVLIPLVDSVGYMYMAIGAWGVVGGVGLIKDQEWGWGISLVVLSTVIVAFLAEIIVGFMAETWTDILLWIKLAALILAAGGIVYLLLTKEKYE